MLDKVFNTLKTLQIYPSTTRIECNDKVTKSAFNRSFEQYENLLNGNSAGVVEKKNHKKKGKLITSYTLQNSEGYGNKIPLDEFDRAVFGAVLSEWLAGNLYTTPAIIFRSLIGRVGDGSNANPTTAQVAMIEDSIDKMKFTKFDSNAAENLEELNYSNGDKILIECSEVLPIFRVKAVVGGKEIKAIFLDREPPYWIIANAKNQVIRYDSNLLYTGDHYNTRHKIAVTHYGLRRAMEIVYHKDLTPVITFDDIWRKCRVENESRKVKSTLRDNIFAVFENLKQEGIIKNFSIEKKGPSYHGVKIVRKM